MVLEKGGRADKAGNRYELKCILYELLDVINEKNYSVTVEAIGDDEKGTDIVVVKESGKKEFIQCKASNNIKASWSIPDLKRIGLLKNWKFQLDRDSSNSVSLMSPLGSPVLETLVDRAKNTDSNSIDFYSSQICTSEKIKKGYNDICNALGLNYGMEDNKNTPNIEKSIDYLKRISVKQFSIFNLDRMIDDKIEFLFLSEISTVKNALLSFIVDGDILGNEITLVGIKKYIDEQNLVLRMLESYSNKDFQRMNALNEEYRAGFMPINNELIIRSEFEKCIDYIRQEKSFVISGQAGVGKSGCTEAIINYCVSEDIPYIAIKLDRKIPFGSCEAWGKNLGFSCSFVYALNRLSINKNAVIILDQLDALRWTQANSAQAIGICMQLIGKVELLNQERGKKISIVFVCRKYDIENDNNIKLLFEKHDNKQMQIEWDKIDIGEFDDYIVENIVGKNYNTLSTKLKRLVKIPSNLYIWEKIDNKESVNDCVTAGQLINIWYKQICRNFIKEDITGKLINDLVEKLEKNGLLYIPKAAIEIELSVYEYLVSSGMIIENDKKIGFVHQSILDYFISKRMIKEYYAGENVDKIIGSKSMQTPAKRYQVQMFLQNILEYDINEFLNVADSILDSEDIRYYIKYLVYECIVQIDKLDSALCDYIIAKISDSDDITIWLNNVIYGKKQFISMLLENNILAKWFNDKDKKNIVFNLLQSVSKDLTNEEIVFMEKHSFIDEEDDKKFASVLWYEISTDSEYLFEYRMKLYSKYPELIKNIYLQLKKLLPKYEKRVVRIIALWHENKDIIEKKPMSGIDSIVEDNSDYKVKDGEYIIQKLLKYVPQDDSYTIKYSDWANHYYHDISSEILIMGMIKKANTSIINSNPKLFWDYYVSYFGKGFYLFDELIVYGLKYLPKDYSDRIMLYICQDFDNNIYDKTSGVVDQLQYTKEAIRIHSQWCSEEVVLEFETKLIHYTSKRAVDRYKRRIKYNNTKEYGVSYESYWGELQYELLNEVQYDRLSIRGKELLEVLKRKYKVYYSPYLNSNMHSGTVNSPVTGKNIGIKQWKQIITNKKLLNQRNRKSKTVKGGFVESSIYMYASDFRNAVSKNPEEMIKMVLANKEDVIPTYIDSLYSGIAFSENINDVKQDVFETLFQEFPCDMEGERALYFCEILEKRSELNWSSKTYEQLKEIVANYHMYIDYSTNEDDERDSRYLYEHALSCVKGHAATAIEKLIQHNDSLFNIFKESIVLLTQDEYDYVKMASLIPLWSVYNIDRKWAQEIIIDLYENNIRLIRLNNSKDLLFSLYGTYKYRVVKITKKCFESADDELVKVGCYCMCELYIQYDEFDELISKTEIMNENQTKYIIDMAIAYLNVDRFKQKAKDLICKYKEIKYDVEFPLSRIFYDELVDLKCDQEFISEVVSSSCGRKITHAFVEFIEKSTYSIKEFGNIILELCKKIMMEDVEIINKQWGLAEELSKLVISLYDECANTNNPRDKKYAEECLDVWDYMFENQIGYTRELSQQLMER